MSGSKRDRTGDGDTYQKNELKKSRNGSSPKLDLSNAPLISEYERGEKLGNGMYGEVFAARHIKTGEKVAIKELYSTSEASANWFEFAALREVKILRGLHHENIIHLICVATKPVSTKDSHQHVYLVMELGLYNFSQLLKSKHASWFTQSQIKRYMLQLLQALQYCHAKNVIHRDLKPHNIIVCNGGVLKLADFGVARVIGDAYQKYTNNVVTRWYRAPELLLGATSYSFAIDMWAFGCIFAEIMFQQPVMPGTSDEDQLRLIWELCGSPDTNEWTSARNYPHFRFLRIPQGKRRAINIHLGVGNRSSRKQFFTPQAIDLIDKLLQLDPEKRLTATSAMEHTYFKTLPYPCKQDELPVYNKL